MVGEDLAGVIDGEFGGGISPAGRPRLPVRLMVSLLYLKIHFTPTYSSWLNQVENWFSRIQRNVISRGIFTSVKDLDEKLMRYIREHNKSPKPIKWKYDNPNRRHHQFF